MIQGPDILSKEPSAKLSKITKGYVIKCNSQSGICFDILGSVYSHDDDGIIDNITSIPTRKPRAKFYLKYVIKGYRTPRMSDFDRTEYYLPNGELIFVSDVYAGHGEGRHDQTLTLSKLFNQYYDLFKSAVGSGLRKKNKSKPKPKRVKCKCKK